MSPETRYIWTRFLARRKGLKVSSDDVKDFNGDFAASSAGSPDDLLLCSRVFCGRRDNLLVTTRSFGPNLIIYSFISLLLGAVYILISLNETEDARDLSRGKGGRVTNVQ